MDTKPTLEGKGRVAARRTSAQQSPSRQSRLKRPGAPREPSAPTTRTCRRATGWIANGSTSGVPMATTPSLSRATSSSPKLRGTCRQIRGGALAATRLESPAMHAATIREGELLVDEHPDPEPGRGEVLVRVRAAGINGGDLHQRAGRYPAPPGWPPDIPGMELAGEVAARGPDA